MGTSTAVRAIQQRKRPVQRVFRGLAGSPLATRPAPQKKQSAVLVHFCFDQERGETKPTRCNCFLRLSMNEVYEHIDEGRADFLLSPNPKTTEPVKNHKAIVVRRAVVEGETIFAIARPDQTGRVCDSAAELTVLRNRVRGIIQKLVARGVFPPSALDALKGDLDELLDDPSDLLKRLKGQKRFQDEVSEIVKNWATLRAKLPAREPYLSTGGNSSSWLEMISAAVQTDTGRVAVANHRASYWSGGWDYSAGNSPKVDETDDDRESRIADEHSY